MVRFSVRPVVSFIRRRCVDLAVLAGIVVAAVMAIRGAPAALKHGSSPLRDWLRGWF